MTPEERAEIVEQLRTELLEKFKHNPLPRIQSAYTVAHHNCEAYFIGQQLPAQHYGALMVCENMAWQAFKERHGAGIKGNNLPNQYIQTEEDGKEYFELFKAFLTVYQTYLSAAA